MLLGMKLDSGPAGDARRQAAPMYFCVVMHVDAVHMHNHTISSPRRGRVMANSELWETLLYRTELLTLQSNICYYMLSSQYIVRCVTQRQGRLYMVPQRSRKRAQEEIFSSYNWWDKRCALNHITVERSDYIESCIDKVFGREALRQQEVLDIGCGGGLICETLVQRGATAIGIDPSYKALAAARTHAQQSGLGHNVYYEQGYAESLPYADGSFSTIVCLDVLEHVNDLHTTIREITRVLAPGGIFIFDTINRTLMARIVLIWIGERFLQDSGLRPGLHNYRDFIKPLTAAGYRRADPDAPPVGSSTHCSRTRGGRAFAQGGSRSQAANGAHYDLLGGSAYLRGLELLNMAATAPD